MSLFSLLSLLATALWGITESSAPDQNLFDTEHSIAVKKSTYELPTPIPPHHSRILMEEENESSLYPQIIHVIPPQILLVGEFKTLNLSAGRYFKDPQNEKLTLEVIANGTSTFPSFIQFDAISELLTLRPQDSHIANYTLLVNVHNDYGEAWQLLLIKVQDEDVSSSSQNGDELGLTLLIISVGVGSLLIGGVLSYYHSRYMRKQMVAQIDKMIEMT